MITQLGMVSQIIVSAVLFGIHILKATTSNTIEIDCGLWMVMTGTASVSSMAIIALFGVQSLRLVIGDKGLSLWVMTVPS